MLNSITYDVADQVVNEGELAIGGGGLTISSSDQQFSIGWATKIGKGGVNVPNGGLLTGLLRFI